MARTRGFFAELQHQAEVAAREQARRQREAERQQAAAIRAAEQARKASERATAQAARATAAEQKRLEKEARDAHIAAMEAEVLRLNGELSQTYEEIDTLLAATLTVDDHVDLETLRAEVEHPPFDRSDLERRLPEPPPIPDPPQPAYVEPPAPKGLAGMFGKKKHEDAVVAARQAHERAMANWSSSLPQVAEARRTAAEAYAQMEADREAALAKEQARYLAECREREEAVTERNAALDTLIANLGYGSAEAIEEYVAIVFSQSQYPDAFPVQHEYEFNSEYAELVLRVLVPGPDKLPTTSAYKYVKAADEISPGALSQKALKDRYNNAVYSVALRSLHEVFEADRRGLVATISVEVATETIDPATGLPTDVLFVAVAAERAAFLALDLSNVIPAATLAHLGAAVSKNPFGLVAARADGIRRS